MIVHLSTAGLIIISQSAEKELTAILQKCQISILILYQENVVAQTKQAI